MQIDDSTPAGVHQAGLPPDTSRSTIGRGKRGPVVCRRVDVAAIETVRLEKGLSRLKLCVAAKVDPAAYLNLLRYEGRRSRDAVIIGVARALGLPIKEILTISPVGQEVL